MSGGPGGITVWKPLAFAIDVAERLRAFHRKYDGRMSADSDKLSADALEAIDQLMRLVKVEQASWYQQGFWDSKMGRPHTPPCHTCNQLDTMAEDN